MESSSSPSFFNPAVWVPGRESVCGYDPERQPGQGSSSVSDVRLLFHSQAFRVGYVLMFSFNNANKISQGGGQWVKGHEKINWEGEKNSTEVVLRCVGVKYATLSLNE